MSKYFIDLLDEYDKKDFVIEAKKTIISQKKLSESKLQTKKAIKLLKDMLKKTIELSSEINVLKPFDKGNYLISGYKSGEITINEHKDINFYEKLKIKEFDTKINHICEIDKNIIMAMDENNKSKVIQINEDFTGYKIIKKLEFEKDDKIYKIISLPILSYYKNRNFFAIAKNKSLLIYKSNKMPINLEPPGVGYHNQVEEFSIVQPSFIQNDEEKKNEELNFFLENNILLKYSINNMLEINEKYLVVVSHEENLIKFFNTQNNFKEDEIKIDNFKSNEFCPMIITKNRKKLLIGYEEGISIIDIDYIKNIKNLRIKHSVYFMDSLIRNTLYCLFKKNDDYIIRQYQFKNGIKEVDKLSESIILNENDISNMFAFKNKIYYIDNSKNINYYE